MNTLVAFGSLLTCFLSPMGGLISLRPRVRATIMTTSELKRVLSLRTRGRRGRREGVTPRDLTKSVGFRRIGFECKAEREMLRSVSFAVGGNRGVTFIKRDNSKGAALSGLLLRLCRTRSNGVLVGSGGVRSVRVRALESGVTCVPRRAFLFDNSVFRGLALKLSSTAVSSVVRTSGGTRTRRFVGGLPLECRAELRRGKTGLSNNRERELTVTETVLGGPSVLVLSRTADGLSTVARETLSGAVDRFSGSIAAVFVTRELDAVGGYSGVCILRSKGVVRDNSRTSLATLNKGCTRLIGRRSLSAISIGTATWLQL